MKGILVHLPYINPSPTPHPAFLPFVIELPHRPRTMTGGGLGKSSKIRQFVRLRKLLRRWRRRSSPSASAPPDVPAGHVAVAVGSSSRRFVVRAAHLNHPAFQKLLRAAEEEYGFANAPGPLAIPCDELLFEEALSFVSAAGVERWPESRPLLW